MFKVKSFILVSLCFLFLTRILFSQYIVQGTVTDNGAEYLGNGAEPVIGALVTITDQADTNHTFSSYTGEQGHYSIEITQTLVDDDPSVNPGAFQLLQNYPNPFNPSTVIGYKLSKPDHISIEIYNVLGQKVKTLVDGFQSTSGQVTWNGTNDMGLGVPAGLYIYSLKAGGQRINRKMLLIDGHQGRIHTPATPSFSPEHSSNSELLKQLSDQYVLTVTGASIAPYEQHDLEITASMTVDVTVTRTVTDIDGNVYVTVKIGDQWWMAENLKVTHYRNGDPISNVTDSVAWEGLNSGAYCNYMNDDTYYPATYGHLYNWFAVDDSRNITPTGWHVPSDEEWKELEICLGMSQADSDRDGWRSGAGNKMKETGIAHWISPNFATNESGFTALPGGARSCYSNTNYGGWGYNAYFWSSTGFGDSAYFRQLTNIRSDVNRVGIDCRFGFSVRCVRD